MREQYETYASVYGYGVVQWPGYAALADIREFTMVTWIASKADETSALQTRRASS